MLDRLSPVWSRWSVDTSVPPPRRVSLVVLACLALLAVPALWSLGENGDVYVVAMALALGLESGMSLWWWRSWVAAGRPPRNAKLRLLSFVGAVLLLIAFTRLADPFAHPSDVIVLLFVGFGYSVVTDELVTRREIAATA